MTASATFNEYSLFEAKAMEDARTISTAVDTLKQEFVSCVPDEKEVSKNIEKVFNMTSMSIKMYATSYYKKAATLDTMEVEQIKMALDSFKADVQRVQDFKTALIEDLATFQKQIKTNHVQKIANLVKEKQEMEKELFSLNVQKNKLIMDRLSRIAWPYDEKTKQYDSKIASAEARIQQYTNKIQELQSKRPAANEKDILIYQMKLKERFAQK